MTKFSGNELFSIGDLLQLFLPNLEGSYKEGRGSIFTRSHMEKTSDNRYKFCWIWDSFWYEKELGEAEGEGGVCVL